MDKNDTNLAAGPGAERLDLVDLALAGRLARYELAQLGVRTNTAALDLRAGDLSTVEQEAERLLTTEDAMEETHDRRNL